MAIVTTLTSCLKQLGIVSKLQIQKGICCDVQLLKAVIAHHFRCLRNCITLRCVVMQGTYQKVTTVAYAFFLNEGFSYLYDYPRLVA